MLSYLGRHDLHPSDGQLVWLLRAFDIAWDQIEIGPYSPQDRRDLHDKVAAAVVDLVLISGMTRPDNIAATALRRVAAQD